MIPSAPEKCYIRMSNCMSPEMIIFYDENFKNFVLSFMESGHVVQLREKNTKNIVKMILNLYSTAEMCINYPSTLEQQKKDKIKRLMGDHISKNKKIKTINSYLNLLF